MNEIHIGVLLWDIKRLVYWEVVKPVDPFLWLIARREDTEIVEELRVTKEWILKHCLVSDSSCLGPKPRPQSIKGITID